jgi:hypothetical protein
VEQTARFELIINLKTGRSAEQIHSRDDQHMIAQGPMLAPRAPAPCADDGSYRITGQKTEGSPAHFSLFGDVTLVLRQAVVAIGIASHFMSTHR